MQIVIKISDEDYKAIAKGYLPFGAIADAIRNGTILPKGHGDLIDRSKVIKNLFDYCEGKKTIGQCIDDVQTIIEADKGE